ncbi:ROK family protein [Streptomyces sp. MST-110588]|nr:ROK family protein [Streptomyces sp. MST-110588]
MVDPHTGGLSRTPGLPGWEEPGVRTALAERLGTDICFLNDANLAAHAELHHGAAVGVDNFVLLWVDEGVGAAIVTQGVVHTGASGQAGEVYGIAMPGSRGGKPLHFHETVDAEALLALAAAHGITADDAVAAMGVARSGAAGAPGVRLLSEYAERLAAGLAVLVSVLDPELVVLSGELLAAGGERLRALTGEALPHLVPRRPRLALSHVPDDPVVAGALSVALQDVRSAVLRLGHPEHW